MNPPSLGGFRGGPAWPEAALTEAVKVAQWPEDAVAMRPSTRCGWCSHSCTSRAARSGELPSVWSRLLANAGCTGPCRPDMLGVCLFDMST